MWVLETVAVAFSMYSALPAPRVEWNEKNMRYALIAFPLVGAVLGLAWWGVCVLSAALALPELLRGALLCAQPALLTGGIHLDGYADTCDALASRASPEKLREILRDPRCGAFAMLRLCLYFLVSFALCCAVEPAGPALWCMGLGFVLSRALSALALTRLPVAEGSSLARTFADAADKRRVYPVLSGLLALTAGAMFWIGAMRGAAMVFAAVAAAWRYARVSEKRFGGTSGDLAGWFLVKAEFWMLAALVAVQYAEELV